MKDKFYHIAVKEFKLYPTEKQKILIDKEIDFYNRYYSYLRKEMRDYIKKNGDFKSFFEAKSKCNEVKANILKKYRISNKFHESHFSNASDNFANRYNYKNEKIIHVFKKQDSIRLSKNDAIKVENGYFFLDRTPIKIRPKIDKLDKGTYFNLIRNEKGYFLNVIYFERPITSYFTGNYCGIDLGVRNTLTLVDTNGEVMKYDIWNDKLELWVKKLRHYRLIFKEIQKHNPDYKNSNNAITIDLKIYDLYRKIRNYRTTQYNRICAFIAKRYDYISIEGMDLESIYKDEKFRTKFSILNFSDLRKILKNQAAKYHKNVFVCKRTFPSSQLCSNCGLLHEEMNNMNDFHETLKCECGCEIDRDINAAINLLKEMISKLDLKLKGERRRLKIPKEANQLRLF